MSAELFTTGERVGANTRSTLSGFIAFGAVYAVVADESVAEGNTRRLDVTVGLGCVQFHPGFHGIEGFGSYGFETGNGTAHHAQILSSRHVSPPASVQL
jgi:hypothetical protein